MTLLNPVVQKRMRQFGFRLTPQRELILQAVASQGEHATFDEVVAATRAVSPRINPATVYRTLETFSRYRLIHRNEIAGGEVYEIAGAEAHHHLLCHKCWGDIKVSDKVVQRLFKQLDKDLGFLVLGEHYIFMGLCPDCRRKEGDTLSRFNLHPKFRVEPQKE